MFRFKLNIVASLSKIPNYSINHESIPRMADVEICTSKSSPGESGRCEKVIKKITLKSNRNLDINIWLGDSDQLSEISTIKLFQAVLVRTFAISDKKNANRLKVFPSCSETASRIGSNWTPKMTKPKSWPTKTLQLDQVWSIAYSWLDQPWFRQIPACPQYSTSSEIIIPTSTTYLQRTLQLDQVWSIAYCWLVQSWFIQIPA